jgi:FAD/FMN-containing dehydrogenase
VTGAPADVAAVRGDGTTITLTGRAIRDLQAGLRGRLLMAATEGYETARQVLNPSIDRRPALIVQTTGVEDVRRAVLFAREHALLTAVKCGGHSFSGMSTCDGGIMIDLSSMRSVRVDPRARRVWAAGGTLLGLIDHESAPYELVTTMEPSGVSATMRNTPVFSAKIWNGKSTLRFMGMFQSISVLTSQFTE